MYLKAPVALTMPSRGAFSPADCRPRALVPAQRGASLVEVLVTVVLLTLGITSMTNLQITALKLNHSAYLRSQAVSLSYRVLDAMRANRALALGGAYDHQLDDPLPTPAAAASSVAAADMRAWLMSIENATRPYDGQAAIERDGTRMTVTVRWRNRMAEERAASFGEVWESFSVATEL